MLWSDNMQVPNRATHQGNAEELMNYYYEPAVAAELAAYVNYICPVVGAQDEMANIDPELAENELIFPSESTLSNETVFMALSQRPGGSRSPATGRPVPGADARLLDEAGRPVAAGERGVLWVRTPSLAAGYWRRPDAAQRAFVDGWFRTGDLCYRDADGDYVHCGRDDDSFKVAGMWVQPSEVEAAALEHPGVLEAGAVGALAATGLVKPFLFVVARDASAPAAPLVAALGARLSDALPPHHRPQRISVVAELPRTTTGKLQRFRLRQLAESGPEAAAPDGRAAGGAASGAGG